jgi:hypothetical protein
MTPVSRVEGLCGVGLLCLGQCQSGGGGLNGWLWSKRGATEFVVTQRRSTSTWLCCTGACLDPVTSSVGTLTVQSRRISAGIALARKSNRFPDR